MVHYSYKFATNLLHKVRVKGFIRLLSITNHDVRKSTPVNPSTDLRGHDKNG